MTETLYTVRSRCLVKSVRAADPHAAIQRAFTEYFAERGGRAMESDLGKLVQVSRSGRELDYFDTRQVLEWLGVTLGRVAVARPPIADITSLTLFARLTA